MSDRNFSRRRRGGMRFRPRGGFQPGQQQQQQPDRGASDARAEVTGQKAPESLFDRKRHEQEIERAQNIAAGLPPDAKIEEGDEGMEQGQGEQQQQQQGQSQRGPREGQHQHGQQRQGQGRGGGGRRRQYREPHLETPAEVKEDEYQPVELKEKPPQGFVDSIKHVATKVIKHVHRLIKRKQPSEKEVIINAESLETRVAVIEKGILEEFTIERTGEERLVGSIFKGKVRNLEDGLKAAFVDIGFEKNAFLHYWDIVPTSFDSAVEVVERDNQKRRNDRPRITQRDIPRLYPPGSDIIVQVTKGPIGTKGPRVTTNVVLPGRFLVLLPNSDQSGISRKIENQEERQRLKKILREFNLPDGMGVIMRTAGEGQKKAFFIRDLAMLIEQWNEIQANIKKQPSATCVFQEPDLIERAVRDFLTEDVERIVVDSSQAHQRMREIISKFSPRSADKVKLYAEHQPIFDRFNITKQLE
ncbi:MAG: ribonuclease E/G, partial [Limisphaerales bacterium]